MSLTQDVRFGWRSLWKRPAFAVAALLTLALGIGATTAVYSVVRHVLLAPLPYRDADHVAVIWSKWRGFDKTWLSDAEAADYKTHISAFEDAGTWGVQQVNLTGEGDPARVGSAIVTPNLFSVLGVTPLMAAAGLSVSTRDTRGDYSGDVQSRAIALLELLVAAGADVNARVTDTSSRTARIARPSSMTDREGQTALYGAINWGWAGVVKYLIAHGARTDVADARGKTPLDALTGGAGGRDHRPSEEVAALLHAAMASPGS